jgi:hypothetical protein
LCCHFECTISDLCLICCSVLACLVG